MNPEALDYWTRAVQALKTAGLLSATDPDAAASRAYYAAFHAVSALFALRRVTFSRHTALEAAVHRDLVKTGQWSPDLGADFSFLLRLRATGDYGGAAHVSKEDAAEAVAASSHILGAVRDAHPAAFENARDGRDT